MDEVLNVDSVQAVVRRVSLLMSPAAGDTTAMRIAKKAFRASLIVAGTAVLTVVLSPQPVNLETA